MSNTILIKRSGTANSVPLAVNLSLGELAINYNDGNLFYKDAGGVVQTLVSTQFVSVAGNVTGGNIRTAGTVSATGNIQGNYFIGNGSQLTGITVAAGASIQNGTSNVTVSASSNITANVAGSAIATFASTGEYVTGLISATGNIVSSGNVSGNYILGNGALLTGVITSVANINNGTSNITIVSSGGNIAASVDGTSNVVVWASTGEYVTGLISATGNITGGNLITAAAVSAASVSASGNVVGGNVRSSGVISATTTVFGAGLSIGVGGAQVTGNITGGNLLTGGLISATGNVTGGNVITGGLITASGNVTGGNLITAAAVSAASVSASGNVTGGNLISSALTKTTDLSVSGNIIGNLLPAANAAQDLGSPTQLWKSLYLAGNTLYLNDQSFSANATGISTANAFAAGNFNTSGAVSATGNVTGGNLNAAGQVSAAANITGGNIITGGLITATGGITSTANVTGGNIISIAAVSAASVSASGNVTGGNVITGGLITAIGNIIGGNIITSAAVSAASVSASGAIIAVGNVTGGNIVTAAAVSAASVSASGNVTGGNLISSAAVSATSVSASGNVTGGNLISSAAVSATSVSASGNVTGGNIVTAAAVSAASVTASGNITGGNVNTNTLVGTGTTIKSTGDVNLSATGNIVVNSTHINNLADPVQDQDAATKYYVDSVAQGLHIHDSANLATTQDLATYTGATVTYNNGSSGVGATLSLVGNTLTTLDGTAIPAASTTRLLIKDQANAVQNGMYTYTSSSLLTRATDFDTSAEAAGGDFLFVTSGATQADTGWVQTTDNPTMGVSNLVFTQFSGAGSYTANTAAGLVLNGTVFSAKVDGITTAFDGSGNIIVKAGANLTTPNIGAATGTSLSVTGNVTSGNLNAAGLSLSGNVLSAINSVSAINTTANILGSNLNTGGQVVATGNVTGGNILATTTVYSGGVAVLTVNDTVDGGTY